MSYYDSTLLKTNTENGKDWLVKYLHPPTDKGNSYNGYPDKSTVSTIHTEYRLAYEGLPLAAEPGVNAKSCLFLNGPGLLNPILTATNIDGSDPKWRPTLTNTQLDPKSISDNMGKIRNSYLSSTFQYDATAFNNSGMCYSAQFQPSTYQMTTGQTFRKLMQQKSKHINKFIEHVNKIEGPKAANKYREMAKGNSVDYDMVDDLNALNISFNAFQVVKLDKPIETPSDITMLSPKSYQARSVEGAFVVHQVNEDYNAFKSIRGGNYSSGAINNDTFLLVCCYEYTDPGGLTYIEPFFTDSTEQKFMQDVEWGDWSWSYTMFTGCYEGLANATPLNINIKYIGGFEVAPITRSILNSQAMPPAMFDPMAIETATIITQSRQDAMPASKNAGGVMSAIASSIAPTAIGMISKAISGADGKVNEDKQIAKEMMTSNPPEKLDVVNDSVINRTMPPLSARFGIMQKYTPRKSKSTKLVSSKQLADMRRELAQLKAQMRRRPVRSRSRSSRSQSKTRMARNMGSKQRTRSKSKTKVTFS